MTSASDAHFRSIEEKQVPLLEFANNYVLNKNPKDELFALLGNIAENPDLSRGYRSVSVDSINRSDASISLGRRVFGAWSRALHGFLCNPSAEDNELSQKILQAIFSNKGGGAALLAGLLITSFGLAPATAAIVAALTMRIVFEPAANEICSAWEENLKGTLR